MVFVCVMLKNNLNKKYLRFFRKYDHFFLFFGELGAFDVFLHPGKIRPGRKECVEMVLFQRPVFFAKKSFSCRCESSTTFLNTIPIGRIGAMNETYLPILIQVAVAIGFAAMILILSVLFGKRAKDNRAKVTPYECGMLPEGDGAPRFSIKFYIVAMLFVIFDIEVVFLYPWAVIFRDFVMENAMAFWSMTSFIVVLFIAYLYAVRKGVITWTRNVR